MQVLYHMSFPMSSPLYNTGGWKEKEIYPKSEGPLMAETQQSCSVLGSQRRALSSPSVDALSDGGECRRDLGGSIRIQHQGWEDHVRSAYSPFSPWIPETRNTICTNPQYCQPLIAKQELGTSVCPLGDFLLGNQCPHLRSAALACVFYRVYFSSPPFPLREYSTVHAFGIR